MFLQLHAFLPRITKVRENAFEKRQNDVTSG